MFRPRPLQILRILTIFAGILALPGGAVAQTLDVTFRYIRSGVEEFIFVPGELGGQPGSFTDWGRPYNGSGCIPGGHVSQLQFVSTREYYWRKTFTLPVGARLYYKIQTQVGNVGTNCTWIQDPLNPLTDSSINRNSVLDITDPMAFQPAEEPAATKGLIGYFSVGLFSTRPITAIAFTINGVVRTDGLDYFDAATGIFRFKLDRDVRTGAQFIIEAMDDAGRSMRAEIGKFQPPVAWTTAPFSTYDEQTVIGGALTRLDGSVDPSVTEVTVFAFGNVLGTYPVSNGLFEAEVPLVVGPNVFEFEATIDGATYRSSELTVTRRLSPLDTFLVDATVSGQDFRFAIDLAETGAGPTVSAEFAVDARLSTTGVSDVAPSGLSFSGTAAGPGEIFVDVLLTAGPLTDRQRVAVLIEADGTARAMEYDENAEWTKKAVVYEIFPYSFGAYSTGTTANPGRRLKDITAELDYIAGMGFNTIWFMPIMANENLSDVGAGYNIIDFYRVDPKIGSNEDFRALVERAHELGIRIVLDWTPNHVSENHPWIRSLRVGGPFAEYIQTTPSAHNRGLDGRGANLSEIWQTEGGKNFYRKYDGFGDLANLNWDNDGLQAEMLEVVKYWVEEYGIDGWRFDVYWGPWRRYGPARFGVPIRQLMKRLRPDAWLLGEIAGTGSGTEVYYADDDNGTKVAGGLDAAYDWSFYHDAINGSYGDLAKYHSLITNGGGNWWPGPNARYFRFLENHDEVRIAWSQRSNPDRIRPLTGMLLTVTGIPMVYAGQEVGYGSGSAWDRRTPVSWDTPRNGEFAALYQRLSHARAQFPAFWTQQFTSIYRGTAVRKDRVFAYTRRYPNENAVVAVNFEDQPVTVTINPSTAIDWDTDGPVPYYDVFADTLKYYEGGFKITVPAYETVVYITSENPGFTLPALPALPYGAVYTGIEADRGDARELPRTAELEPAWPNPFNPRTRIAWSVADVGPVRLVVYDILGRQKAVLEDRVVPAGRYEASLDAAGWPSGMYVVRLEARGEVHTQTLVLVK